MAKSKRRHGAIPLAMTSRLILLKAGGMSKVDRAAWKSGTFLNPALHQGLCFVDMKTMSAIAWHALLTI